MYRRIVLPVDPDGLAESVLPILATLARRSGGEVFVVGATKSTEAPEQRAALEKHVQEATKELTAAGIIARGEVRQVPDQSSVAEAITAASRERGADLVALGSHGRGNLAALIEGSVGRQVLSKLEAPVILVHGRAEAHAGFVPSPLRRILVPVDFSDASRQAVKVAENLAVEQSASVLILHVREMVPWGDVPYIESGAEAEGLVKSLSEEVRRSGADVEVRVLEPELDPAGTIVKAVDEWKADLIVVGSRRLTAVGGLLLGSVAQAILHRTARPVLIAGHPTHEPQRSSPQRS